MRKIKNHIADFIYWIEDRLIHIYIYFIISKKEIERNYHEIPIIINNFNRLTTLCKLIDWLKKYEYNNIIILDNQSTYPPLLDYYKTCDIKVIRLDKNYGHLALWKSDIYHQYKWNYFAYTDSDVLPEDNCPADFLLVFCKALQINFSLKKVGFSIKIDDLPDHFNLKEKVVEYERRYWKKNYHDLAFDAPVDTTFALYKPFTNLKYGEVYTQKAIRMKPPYTIRHLPWYNDTKNLNEEELYYLKSSNSSSSLSNQLSGNTIY